MQRRSSRFPLFPLIIALLVVVSPQAASGAPPRAERKKPMADKTPKRSEIDDKYRWNTTHLYPSDEAWEKERKSIVALFKAIAACRGKLKGGPAVVKTCLDQAFGTRRRLARLGSYANRKFDEDTTVSKYQGYKEIVDKVSTEFQTVTSFIQPELLTLPEQTLRELIADKRLAEYSQVLRDVLRLKPHILSPTEEALLAATSLMRDTGYNVYSTFSGSELKFPTIKDEKGKPVQLTQALFVRYRASTSRAVRKAAFNAFFTTFESFKNTLAALLSAQINATVVTAQARRYRTALDAALDAYNIPTSVYHNMVKAINKHLPTLHRYLRLRQKLLGLKQLEYHDMYPSVIKKVELKFPYDKAGAVLVEALAPLGKPYTDVLATGLKPGSGWVDVFPNQGKKSGAYMDGNAYDVHPFVLGNYLDEYNSLSMLAHEMGHALHSHSSNKHQPFAKSDYPIFVAEVASTLNEALLMQHMLRTTKDPQKRLFLLGEQLESFRQTIFRQAMFAEFELAVYTRAEKKEALTADEISKIYLQVARRYYGHDEGVVTVDKLYGMEWGYIPHFYYNYYVYQYVTGFTAATALAEMIGKGGRTGEQAAERYRKHLLQAGSSDYAITMLKNAGVDLRTTKPYDVAMAVFARALEQAEAVVAKMKL
jgi:oligoendopeptidase F